MPLNNQLHTGALHETTRFVLCMFVSSCMQSVNVVPVAHYRYFEAAVIGASPKQAPDCRVLKMSVCALLKVCVFFCFWPHGTGQFLCGRASCYNMKVVSSSLTQTTFYALQKPL